MYCVYALDVYAHVSPRGACLRGAVSGGVEGDGGHADGRSPVRARASTHHISPENVVCVCLST